MQNKLAIEWSNRLVGDIARRTGAGVVSITAQCRKFRDEDRDIVTTGCHISCANGRTISVQWADGNYSNVGRASIQPGEEPEVEIAVLDSNGDFESIGEPGLDSGLLPWTPLSIAHDIIAKYSGEI